MTTPAARLRASSALALALHAGLIALSRGAPSPEPPAKTPRRDEARDVVELAVVSVELPAPISGARARAPEPDGEPPPPSSSLPPRVRSRATFAIPSGPLEDDAEAPWSAVAPLGGPEAGGAELEMAEPPGLDLRARVDLGPGRAAPTRPPPGRRVTHEETEEAVRSAVRFADAELGLGNPQDGVVARAVQQAGRASGVPSGTHFVVTVAIDREGHVTGASIRGDPAGDAAWPGTLAAMRALLAAAPVPLGPDERKKGVVVRVDATLLHVFPSGSDRAVRIGECVPMPKVGGEAPAPFVSIGGPLHGEPANGLCVLADAADVAALKTIVVRTTTTSARPGDAPLPARAYPTPSKVRRMPQVSDLVTKILGIGE